MKISSHENYCSKASFQNQVAIIYSPFTCPSTSPLTTNQTTMNHNKFRTTAHRRTTHLPPFTCPSTSPLITNHAPMNHNNPPLIQPTDAPFTSHRPPCIKMVRRWKSGVIGWWFCFILSWWEVGWVVKGERWEVVMVKEAISPKLARSYRELDVYILARKLSLEIFFISKSFPKEELYSLTDQVRRSSRSVGAQIAEAWGKRRYKKHFISKLTDADGENQETQHWIDTAYDCDYINEKKHRSLLDGYSSIGRMLNAMIAKAESFCSS